MIVGFHNKSNEENIVNCDFYAEEEVWENETHGC